MLNILSKLNGNFEVKEGENTGRVVADEIGVRMFGFGIHLSWMMMGQLFRLFNILLLFQVSHLQKGDSNALL